MYIYIFNIYISTRTHIHTHTYIYVHNYLSANVYLYIYIYICVFVCLYVGFGRSSLGTRTQDHPKCPDSQLWPGPFRRRDTQVQHARWVLLHPSQLDQRPLGTGWISLNHGDATDDLVLSRLVMGYTGIPPEDHQIYKIDQKGN